MKLALAFLPLLALAASAPEAPIAPRQTPPTITTISPTGAPQGATTVFRIDGSNLAGATAAYFSQSGIKARITKIERLPDPPDVRLGSAGLKSSIDLGPVPQRNVATVEVDVDPTGELGAVSLRLLTPLGLTTAARFVIEPHYPEAKDKEPNDDPEHAVEAPVPSILAGAIAKPGDVDYYKFNAAAGDKIVFQNGGMKAGSALRAALSILDADHRLVKTFDPNTDSGIYTHEFRNSGLYYLKIADFEEGGSARHFYRIVMSQPASLPPSPAAALPSRLTEDHHDVPFHATRGQSLIIEVNAARAGSPLDPVLEILDAHGKPIERATVRAVAENSLTLNDRDSMQPGLRLLTTTGFAVGDYMMVGTEIVRVAITPHGPDEDTFFDSVGGQRVAYLDTTSEGHAMDTPVYKVQILPPGANPAANGLPLVHLLYRNDDGGPGYGKDSLIHFNAPADGQYIARLTDLRGRKGPELTYQLIIRDPHPDYKLALKTPIANVPSGGRVPVTVIASRLEGFDAPIHLSMQDLPPGLHATSVTIPPGETGGTMVLTADPGARLDTPAPLIVHDDNGREASPGDLLRLIAVATPSDIQLSAKTREVTLTPGSKAEITVDLRRNNSFAGRVPIEVRDLPQEIVVSNVGLNGVLINETETTRTFTIEALPNARPVVQTIVVSGKVETRAAAQENLFAGEPIHVVVKAAQ
jgi:hypothetical protein